MDTVAGTNSRNRRADLDIRSGQRVLDVAAGNGNASIAAARRWCEVIVIDDVPKLLDSARLRAAPGEYLEIIIALQ